MTQTVPPEDENKIRGQAIRSGMDVVDQLVGPGTKERVLSEVSRELADAYRYGAIVTPGWYPMSWFGEVHAAIHRQAPPATNISKQVGFAATSSDIRGIYRYILRLTTPSFAFANSGRIIGTYVKNYGSKALAVGAQNGQLEISLPGATPEIWEVVCGAAEAVLAACGARNVTVLVHQRGAGASALLDAHWQASAHR